MSRRVPPAPVKGSFSGTAGTNTKARALPSVVLEAAKRSGLFHHGSGPFTIVPAEAVTDARLGGISTRDVLVALCRFRNGKTGLCCPDQGRMALALGIHRRTLQRHIKKLIEYGYVVPEARTRKDGGWTSNQYWIRFSPLTDVAATTAATIEEDEGLIAPGGKPVGNDATLRRPPPQPLRRPPPHKLKPELNLSEPDTITPVRNRALRIQPPFDPLGAFVTWLAKVTGQHVGEVWGTVLGWHARLQSAGFTDAECQSLLVQAGKDARQAGDGIVQVAATVADRIIEREAAAA